MNPYTQQELTFTRDESRVLGLLDGRRTLFSIARQLRRESGLGLRGFPNALRTVRRTIETLKDGLAYCPAPATPGTVVRIACPRTPPMEWPAAPDGVLWEISRVCNLRCKHCLTAAPFSPAGSSLASPSPFADYPPVIAAFREAGIFSVTLSGGEPLLHPDVIGIVDALNTAGISVDIATNGYGIPDALFEALSTRRISSIQVSIDGFAPWHDVFRGVPGAFERSAAALERFRNVGFRTSISTTVTADNLESLSELAAWAFEKGCSSYKAIPLMPSGRAAQTGGLRRLTHRELYRFSTLIRDLHERYTGRMDVYTASAMLYLLEDQTAVPASAKSAARTDLDAIHMGCAAGHSTLNVGVDGSVSPCPFLRDQVLGNLTEQPLWEIWDIAPLLQELRSLTLADFPEDCRTCPHAGISCSGGCRASALAATGSLSGKDPFCFAGCCADETSVTNEY